MALSCLPSPVTAKINKVVGRVQKRGIFLDRDGVLNESNIINGKPVAPRSLEDFRLIPGVREALVTFRKLGFSIIVVTNQPDLSTGLQSWEGLRQIHSFLKGACDIDLIKVCPHLREDACQCRKPKPGMIFEAAEELNIDLTHSVLVGDRWSDIEAGRIAGIQNLFFIDYGYQERRPDGNFSTIQLLRDLAKELDQY